MHASVSKDMGPRRLFRWLLAVALPLACGCEAPILANDGTVVFPETGAHGANVLTANGVEFHDRRDVPKRLIHRTVDEPWRAPVGFILPRDGRFTQTSRPTVVGTPGLAFALRPSDSRVPSWGGEVLVRVDILAPAARGMSRPAENLAIVLDGSGPDAMTLLDDAIAHLGASDRLMVVDSRGPKLVVPLIPANHRSLAEAAAEKRLGDDTPREPRDLGGAMRIARNIIGIGPQRRVVVLTDGAVEPGPVAVVLAQRMGAGHVPVSVIATRAGADPARLGSLVAGEGTLAYGDDPGGREIAMNEAVPPAGATVFKNVVLTFRGDPAPSHVLETSGGSVRWRLDAGELVLGDVIAGEARTEVVRVTVPPYVSGEPFTFEVTAHATDAQTGQPRTFGTELHCVYDDDIERIAESRYGDVIAYASALATLKRLDAAFVGEGVAQAGGIYALARLHAQSMALLARDTHDRAITEQAEVLNALLAVEHD